MTEPEEETFVRIVVVLNSKDSLQSIRRLSDNFITAKGEPWNKLSILQQCKTNYSHCHWKHKHSLSFTAYTTDVMSWYQGLLGSYKKNCGSSNHQKAVDIPPYSLHWSATWWNHTTHRASRIWRNGRISTSDKLSGMLLHGLLPDSIDSKIGLVSLRAMPPWSSCSSSDSVGLMLIEFALPLLCVSASCWKYACGHRAANE